MPFETFWVAKKVNGNTTLTLQHENPIKSSYELLWDEIRNPNRSPQAIQNTLRRIVEHYFRILGGIEDEKILDMFEGGEKIICGSLFSWINDGSHDVNDDLFMTCDSSTIDAYLCVFKKIFEYSKHDAHYKMMMKITEDEIMDNSDAGHDDMAA